MTDGTALAALLDALAEIPGRLATVERVLAETAAKTEAIRAALPPALATVSEAAAAFKVSIPTLRRWVRKGLLPTVKLGNALRVDLSRLHGVDGSEIARRAAEARKPNTLRAIR